MGLNLITLYYSDINGNSVPINYRIYDKKAGKTKNDYFREMVSEIISFIKLFRKDFKKEDSRHYLLYLPDEEKIKDITRSTFVTIHDTLPNHF
jgi:hypothetical protein